MQDFLEKLNQPLFAEIYAKYASGEIEYTGNKFVILRRYKLPRPYRADELADKAQGFTLNLYDDDMIVGVRLEFEEGRACYQITALTEIGAAEDAWESIIEPQETPYPNINTDEDHELWCQTTLDLWDRIIALASTDHKQEN